jgi:formate dehydrogenase major subunit
MVFGKRNGHGTDGSGNGHGAATTRPVDVFSLPEYAHLSHNGAKLRVATPDIQWFKNNISCQVACPALTDVPRYIRLIAEHNYDESYRVNAHDNLFPEILGRICSHPCETACRRGRIDEPIAICFLKRAAATYRADRDYHLKPPSRYKGSVGIVGSGPAGMAAAHHLTLLGYKAIIYEALPVTGGALTIGIPPYRLPREFVKQAFDRLAAMGVEVYTNTRVGDQVTMQQLEKEHDAIVIAAGCIIPNKLNIPGEDDYEGLYGGVTFMLDINLNPPEKLPRRVAVIGGGFTAIDCVRSSTRLGAEKVYMLYRRTETEMGATPHEVEGAREEGVEVMTLVSPVKIESDDGKRVSRLWLQRNTLGAPDASGRRAPVPIPGSEFPIDVDLIIPAVSQAPSYDFIPPEWNLRRSRRGYLVRDPDTFQTSRDNVYVVGDYATGPLNVIAAIAEGKRAASGIDGYVGYTVAEHFTVEPFFRATNYTELLREHMPSLAPEEPARKQFLAEVDLGFSMEAADREAIRCLQCQINVHIDPDLCILCARCVEACPYGIIYLTSIDNLKLDEDGKALAELTFGQPYAVLAQVTVEGEPVPGQVFALDEDLCIRCGLCENSCPTGALAMKSFEYREVAVRSKQQFELRPAAAKAVAGGIG